MTPEAPRLLGLADPATVEVVHDDGTSTMHQVPRKFLGYSDYEVMRGLLRLLNSVDPGQADLLP